MRKQSDNVESTRLFEYRSQVFASFESSYAMLVVNDADDSACLVVASASLPGEKRGREEQTRPAAIDSDSLVAS